VIRRICAKTVARPLLIGALALLIPAATAGCEAGLDAPTLQFHPASAGAHAVVNGISISNAFVLGAPSGSTLPPGSSAGVFLSLFNGGSDSDTLVSVSAPGSASGSHLSGGAVSLPAGSPVNLTGPQPSVVLSGLTRALDGGETIPLTLNFSHAGSVTLQVPVQPQSFYYSTYSPAPSTAPAATPTQVPTAAPSPGASGTSPAPTKTPTAKPTATPSR
jgi:copper(I)-binding protein